MGAAKKAGDRYNYDVAAFLKTNVFEISSGISLDLREFSFDAAPNAFPPIATSFNQEISMDLIISTSDSEFLCECKSSDLPRRISIKSREFKESLLEFVVLEDYRIRQPRIVKYIMITNMPVKFLENEIQNLRRNPDKLRDYSLELRRQGKRKWCGFDAEIDIKSIQNALENLLIIQIEKGRLREAEKDRRFRDALIEIVQKAERRNPKLVPISLSTKAHLRLRLDIENDSYIERGKLGYTVEISSVAMDQIVAYENSLREDVIKATAGKLSFLTMCHVDKTQELNVNEAAKLITEVINDLIEERLKILSYIAIFFPDLSEMHFVRVSWGSKIVDSHFLPSTGRYSLIKEDEAPISIPPYVSRLLITEIRRLVNGIIVDPGKIEQTIDGH